MGRKDILAAHLAELHRKIHGAEKHKQHILDKIHTLKDACIKKEISYLDYQEKLNHKLDGKSLPEWVEYYDSYIELCKRHIEKHHKAAKNQVYKTYTVIAVSIFFILLFLRSDISGIITGFLVEDSTKSNYSAYEEILSLNLKENQEIQWNRSNYGQIVAVSFTGKVYGNGTVKISLDNIPIVEIMSKKQEISTFQGLTGLVINAEESTLTENQSMNQENITIEINNLKTNQSQQSEKTNTTEESVQEEQIESSFNNICNKDCDLYNYGIQSTSHIIKIELNGVNLSLDKVNYKIISQTDSSQQENATINEKASQILKNETLITRKQIAAGEPVYWKKTVKLDKEGNITVKLPKEATNINAEIIDKNQRKKIEFKEKKKSWLETASLEDREIELSNSVKEYEIIYETPAPTIKEKKHTKNRKEVTISGPHHLNYTNILTSTDLEVNISQEKASTIHLYWLKSEKRIKHSFIPVDTDNDTFIDKISWITPHLSDETFEVIIITQAEHLDFNRTIIESVYNDVMDFDGNWSKEINDSEYVRVTFQYPLNRTRDITVYSQIINGNPTIEVYEVDNSTIIAQFTNLQNEEYNKIFLANLVSQTQDIFDLRVMNGSVKFDHIVDPITTDFSDNFEKDLSKWNGNGNTDWELTTSQKYAGSRSVEGDDDGKFVTDNIDTRNGTFLNVSFWYRDDDLDAGDVEIYFYNGTSYVLIDTSLGTEGAEDTWLLTTRTTTSSQYFKSNFRVKFDLSAGDGEHLWIDDFSVKKTTPDPDIIAPNITLIFPANQTYAINVSNINYTFSQDASYCWYSTNNGITNSTPSSGCSNFTNVPSIEGSQTWTLYANDSAGNTDKTNITFFQDSLKPTISFGIDTEINATVAQRSNIAINVTANDTNLANITVNLYDSSGQTINQTTYSTSPFFLNITNLSNGNYHFNATANDILGNINNTETREITLSALSQAPQILYLSPITDQSITENSFSQIVINFSVQDGNGHTDLNDARLNISRTGEATRKNDSCLKVIGHGVNVNYSCTIDIWYFDAAGDWNISAFINDNQFMNATNTSSFTLLQTSAFIAGPSSIIFNTLDAGSTNVTPTNPILLNNTGNKPIAIGNIQINATNLLGESDHTRGLYAGNFTISTATGGSPSVECGSSSSTFMNSNVFVALIGAILPRGNHSINDGSTGQEQLYLCLTQVGSELSTQKYSTTRKGSWTIKILIVAISLRRRKRIENDRLFNALCNLKLKEREINNRAFINIILEELTEKYGVDKEKIKKILTESTEIKIPLSIFNTRLGALESLSLYLKEKRKLRFTEIGSMINRKDKTIWTAYHNAKNKKIDIFVEQNNLLIPLEALQHKELTIFESLILYLKDKVGLKYNEIAKQLRRNQRNIWTMYSRASKKINEETNKTI